MNPVLEHVCQHFGALSCADASLAEALVMALSAALACILSVWAAGKLLAPE